MMVTNCDKKTGFTGNNNKKEYIRAINKLNIMKER